MFNSDRRDKLLPNTLTFERIRIRWPNFHLTVWPNPPTNQVALQGWLREDLWQVQAGGLSQIGWRRIKLLSTQDGSGESGP